MIHHSLNVHWCVLQSVLQRLHVWEIVGDIYNGTTCTDENRVGSSCILFYYCKNIDVNKYLPTSSRVCNSYNSRLSITKIELSLNKIIYSFTYVGWRAQELASQTTMDLFPQMNPIYHAQADIPFIEVTSYTLFGNEDGPMGYSMDVGHWLYIT